MIFPSKYIESAVSEFSRLPGIGKKTALRLVLHLLKQEKEDVKKFSAAMTDMRNEIKSCVICCNYSDTDICNICSNNSRKKNIVCVVETAREVLAIENTGQYNGSYHVLGGVISPIDGIGPEKLNIDVLLKRIEIGGVEELVMALNPTIEGDTTVFYISKKLSNTNVKISTISRGIAFGSELEYTDEVTLARSIVSRIPYTLEKQN
jgi:recombination protein RecR